LAAVVELLLFILLVGCGCFVCYRGIRWRSRWKSRRDRYARIGSEQTLCDTLKRFFFDIEEAGLVKGI